MDSPIRLGAVFGLAAGSVLDVTRGSTAILRQRVTGANPATNAWRNPLNIMDGRYIRLGMQMSF